MQIVRPLKKRIEEHKKDYDTTASALAEHAWEDHQRVCAEDYEII